MAKLIEFYIPERYHKNVKWIPTVLRGKVIDISTRQVTYRQAS